MPIDDSDPDQDWIDMHEEERELTTAYMTGYHKRDYEVADLKRQLEASESQKAYLRGRLSDLRAHADALAGAWEELRHDMYQRATMEGRE